MSKYTSIEDAQKILADLENNLKQFEDESYNLTEEAKNYIKERLSTMLQETKNKLLKLYNAELELTKEKEKLYSGDEPNPYTKTVAILNKIICNVNNIPTLN